MGVGLLQRHGPIILPAPSHPPRIIRRVAAERDPYAVLGVAHDAEASAIAAAYRALARQHHPDVAPDEGALQRMAEINAAWTILRDPRRRWAWDRANRVIRTPGGASGAAGAGAAGAGPASAPPDHAASARGNGHAGRVAWRRGPNGEGAAGPPPGSPRGSVLPFGRHIGWSLGEIARVDPGYLRWLADRREGEPYREEIAALLAAMTAREPDASRSSAPPPGGRRRLPFG
jgi:curved DNA-binding protein CbpA